jgi:hypothetical protein
MEMEGLQRTLNESGKTAFERGSEPGGGEFSDIGQALKAFQQEYEQQVRHQHI